MTNILDREIQYLPGIGPKRAELLGKELNIFTFKDLLYTFPFRYIDKSKIYSIREVESSMAYVQLRGKISKISIIGERGGKRVVAVLSDETGSIDLVFFKGIKWIESRLLVNQEYIVFGKPTIFNEKLNIVHPEFDKIGEESNIITSSMIGVYSNSDKLKSNAITIKVFTKFIYNALNMSLEYIQETLPEHIISQNGLIPLKTALKEIHFPKNLQSLSAASYRLKFEELFYLQLSIIKQKNIKIKSSTGTMIQKVGDYFNNCFKKLPFELTNGQKRAIKEIRSDMTSGKQMNRLLQGDVGSGKTLVAVLSALLVADNGYQSCIMAPTEVLANQHFNTLTALLSDSGIKISLLTGSTKSKEREEINEWLQNGTIGILIGTHAIIEEEVKFSKLALAIIDEQHRFGVEQRAKLRFKSPIAPHILVMTATPIPRTLAMTVYGDLDVSIINELPPGRKPIQTIQANESQRDKVFTFVKGEIDKGRQVFIVYPLIKESETMDYKNLEEGYETITRVFPAPKYVTAVVHGQQKTDNKAYDMNLFAQGRANILVATSVIEVGVDVPNASVMIIESAERFGLSQLHQLRGRVGRGSDKSYCILMTGYKLGKDSRKRIDLMCSTQDGFELAEEDMKMRGYGDIEGTQQSGIAIDLKISNLSKDGDILNLVRNIAFDILQQDPLLESKENTILAKQLSKMKKTDNTIDYSNIS